MEDPVVLTRNWVSLTRDFSFRLDQTCFFVLIPRTLMPCNVNVKHTAGESRSDLTVELPHVTIQLRPDQILALLHFSKTLTKATEDSSSSARKKSTYLLQDTEIRHDAGIPTDQFVSVKVDSLCLEVMSNLALDVQELNLELLNGIKKLDARIGQAAVRDRTKRKQNDWGLDYRDIIAINRRGSKQNYDVALPDSSRLAAMAIVQDEVVDVKLGPIAINLCIPVLIVLVKEIRDIAKLVAEYTDAGRGTSGLLTQSKKTKQY